jgi:ferric-dicitrate binding protein FerR (iron transport regulator)
MTTSIRKIQILMFCLTLVFVGGMSRPTQASDTPEEQVGLLTVNGTVRVNGKPAATGDIVAAGSEVQTATGSSAVVSLGKLGRIEALPSTTMKLRYDIHTTSHASASIAILLGDGSIKVSAAKEGMVNVETRDTATRASLGAEKVFTVDKTCGNTLVSVAEGKVELRFGHTVKQIAAGGQDTAGQAKPGCTLSRNR